MPVLTCFLELIRLRLAAWDVRSATAYHLDLKLEPGPSPGGGMVTGLRWTRGAAGACAQQEGGPDPGTEPATWFRACRA